MDFEFTVKSTLRTRANMSEESLCGVSHFNALSAFWICFPQSVAGRKKITFFFIFVTKFVFFLNLTFCIFTTKLGHMSFNNVNFRVRILIWKKKERWQHPPPQAWKELSVIKNSSALKPHLDVAQVFMVEGLQTESTLCKSFVTLSLVMAFKEVWEQLDSGVLVSGDKKWSVRLRPSHVWETETSEAPSRFIYVNVQWRTVEAGR